MRGLGARWGWVVNTKPRPPYPQRKTWYPLYRKLGEPGGRSGRVWRKEYLVPTRALEPRTVQPVARRYTDYDIPAPLLGVGQQNTGFCEYATELSGEKSG